MQHPAKPPVRTVALLGTAQTLAWASSYYLPAVLGPPMAREFGLSTPTVFAAFSGALIASAMVGPWAGRTIDRHGGRPLLMATSVAFALALAALASAQGPATLLAGWLLLGVAMGAGLYDSAFASLVRLYGSGSRGAITGITLLAGFASTVGWPLSAWMEGLYGWRGACLGWAALHLAVGLPLNAALPSIRSRAAADPGPLACVEPASKPHAPAHAPGRPRLTASLLAFVFASGWFVATAMATHLPSLLQGMGLTAAAAAGMGALIGPAQVGARMLEFAVLQRWHPLLSARLACLAHPAGAGLMALFGLPFAAAFTVMHGAGQGILTIAKGTLPLAFFGPDGYGARLGWIALPARVSQAAAPFLFGLALAQWGSGALVLTSVLGLLGFGALWWLPRAAAPLSATERNARVSAP